MSTDLQIAGCDLEAADPHALQIHNRGQEIAITVTGSQDGTFDGGDAVRFYGQGLDTKYSSTNVYWLTTGTSPGRRNSTAKWLHDCCARRPR